jgi:hypothetical protein
VESWRPQEDALEFGRAAFSELCDVYWYHRSPDEAAAFERESFEAEEKSVREA